MSLNENAIVADIDFGSSQTLRVAKLGCLSRMFASKRVSSVSVGRPNIDRGTGLAGLLAEAIRSSISTVPVGRPRFRGGGGSPAAAAAAASLLYCALAAFLNSRVRRSSSFRRLFLLPAIPRGVHSLQMSSIRPKTVAPDSKTRISTTSHYVPTK